MANKYAHLTQPQRDIDLHELTRDEALQATRTFIDDCLNDGIERALIITGKGKHSPDGAIIKPAVSDYLSSKGIEHESAKRDQGGDGAFFIRLPKK